MIYYGNKNLKFHIPSEGQTYWKETYIKDQSLGTQ